VRNGFTTKPKADDMVTEHCSPTGTCLLCVACGWQGHAEVPDAPWVVFQTHECRLSVRSVSSFE
jgi:hypothetical protein